MNNKNREKIERLIDGLVQFGEVFVAFVLGQVLGKRYFDGTVAKCIMVSAVFLVAFSLIETIVRFKMNRPRK